MSNYLPDLRSALVRAAERQAQAETPKIGEPSRRARSTFRSLTGALPIVSGVVIAVAVAVGAGLTLGHRTSATRPTAPRAASLDPYVSPADPVMRYVNPVLNPPVQYPACRRRTPLLIGSPQRISHAAPVQLRSILGVLRRPAAPRDRLPRFLRNHRSPRAGSVIFVDDIRLARVVDGAPYYIVPIVMQSPFSLSKSCVAETRAALHQRLPHIPRTLRTRSIRVLDELIADQQYHSQPHEAICLTELDRGGGSGGSGCGATALDIAQQGTLGSQSGTPPNVLVISGVVPDGVASLTLHWRARSYERALTVTTRAVANVFVVRLHHQGFPDTIVWHDAHGRIIRTLDQSLA